MNVGPSPCHHDVDQVVQTRFEYNMMEWRNKDVRIGVKQGMKTTILRWRRVSVCPSCLLGTYPDALLPISILHARTPLMSWSTGQSFDALCLKAMPQPCLPPPPPSLSRVLCSQQGRPTTGHLCFALPQTPPPPNPTTRNQELNCVEFLAVGMSKLVGYHFIFFIGTDALDV